MDLRRAAAGRLRGIESSPIRRPNRRRSGRRRRGPTCAPSRRGRRCRCSATTRSARRRAQTAPRTAPTSCGRRYSTRRCARSTTRVTRTITGEALVDHVAKGSRLPRKPILLTFDDGTAGQYTRVLPVLRKHGFVATFFPMTVVLGRPGWLTRGQVRALARAGMSIGAHTYDHKAVPDFTGEDWSTQLTEPGRELQRLAGRRSGSSRTRSGCTSRGRSSTCGAPATAPRSSSPTSSTANTRSGASAG